MDMDKLWGLGFEVVGGQINRAHVTYGRCTSAGVEWTEEGLRLVKSLLDDVVVTDKKPRQRKPAQD